MSWRLVRRTIVYVFLSIAAFVWVFPFYWMIVGATNKSALIVRGKTDFGDNLFANAAAFFKLVDVPQVFWNSTEISVIATIATLAVSSTAGYGFEVFRSPIRERLFSFMLLLLTIPFAAIMVPLFSMVARAHLTNTFAAIILPTVASIFIIFYFRQATKAFPGELRDAARVDGLKEWQIFVFIYVPVMRSTYAAATIIVFLLNWNNYLWPLIVLQTNENKTVTLVVSTLLSAYVPDYGATLFATVLATLPTLFIFFALQRQFVAGLTGGVK
jgi:lactose/L-arabinose transport system permease protein